ncbi:MAG: hypothetical protein ABI472_10120 [Ginsengibacter sp.]
MRILFTFILMVFATASQAQTVLPGSFQNNLAGGSFIHYNNRNDSSAQNKWVITRSAGIAGGYSFFSHGGASFVAAPISLQLNRRLSNNVYVFAGVTVAPMYLNFNRTFLAADFKKVPSFNSFYQPGNLSMYSAATMGLIYINDQRTFSVSGSISVERSSYPFYYQNRSNIPEPRNIPSSR